MNSETNDSGWQPHPLWAPLSGHLFLVAVKVPIIVFLLWLSTLLSAVESAPFPTLFWTVVIGMVASETSTTLIERVFVLRDQDNKPGGKANATLQWAGAVVIGFLCGWLLLPSPVTILVYTGLLGLVTAVEAGIVKTWEPGDSPEEVEEKWQRTKQLSRDTFRDDWEEIRSQARQKQRDRYWNNPHKRDNSD